MGRRQFGAVRRLPSGRYKARLPDGTTAPTAFVAKTDATRWLVTAETDMLRGTFIKRRQDDDLTVGEWVEQWHTKHSLHKRPGTHARDRSAIRIHIEPALGSTALASLRPQDVQRFVAELTDTLGAGTTHSVYGVLRSALRTAADLELIERATIRGVRLPSIPKTEVTVLRPTELVRLTAAVPTRWRPMIYVAGVCGLRFAEVAGLRVGRLDLAHRLLHVTETAPQVGPDRAEPKTASGRRAVPMPAFVSALLAQHLQRMELREEDTDALVFTAARGGRLHAGNWHGDVWKPAREAAGFGHSSVQITAEAAMARTSNRRWKGCRMCKPHKHAGNGQAVRKPLAERRQIGKRRRVSRHDLGDASDG